MVFPLLLPEAAPSGRWVFQPMRNVNPLIQPIGLHASRLMPFQGERVFFLLQWVIPIVVAFGPFGAIEAQQKLQIH